MRYRIEGNYPGIFSERHPQRLGRAKTKKEALLKADRELSAERAVPLAIVWVVDTWDGQTVYKKEASV